VRLYWLAVRGALRFVCEVISLMAALAVIGGVARHYLTHPAAPACIITSFAPGPHGSTIYTYSPAGCQPLSPP
jgi:Ni/Fe-hydrogenase subunit HybB-like protein